MQSLRRVVLVEPAINPITRRFGLPVIANYPPLAQARLAAQIDAPDVEIVDLRLEGEERRFLDSLRADPPLLVGISVTFTSNGDEAIALAAKVRHASPRTGIVLGGTAPSEDPASFYASEADLIGFRSGDAALPALVAESRRSGRVPARSPGFFYREDGVWVLDPGPPPTAPRDLRPFAWDRIPSRYWRRYYQGFRLTGMSMTSEGCPFDCSFCSVWKTHGRTVSLMSLENVKHDLRSLPRSVRGLFYADDIWMQASEAQIRQLHDPLHAWMVAEFLPNRSSDFRITIETRTDLYLRQEARFKAWIKDAGLRWILFGVEAASDEQLDAYSKRNTVATNSEAIRRAAEAGALVTTQYVIPCDARESDFDDIERFMREHRPWVRSANFTIATPLPGTDLYRDMLAAHPELADRGTVTHPAFSLFTALTAIRMDPVEFYGRLARLYGLAHQVRFSSQGLKQILISLVRTPWLAPRILTRMPSALRALTRGGTFLEAHRQVQGERLLAPARPSAVQ